MINPLRYSVVVPVYRNRESIPELVARLVDLAASRGGRLEAVFVDDGSTDDSRLVLEAELANGRLPAQVLTLSRNFGSFAAIRAGLAEARGDFVAVMAADLQEPVDLVDSFFDTLETGSSDVVIGERTGRDDPGIGTFGSRLYWWLYRRFVNPEIPPGGVDVFACTAAVARTVAGFPERHTSLVGLLLWVGFRRTSIQYRRLPRRAGRSGWTISRKLRYLFDSIYAFTDLPIIALQVIGTIGIVFSLIFGLVVFIAWAMGGIDQPGYTPLMITLLGSTSAILLGLGVVGSYVWRTYENGMGRPHAIVADRRLYGPSDGMAPSDPTERSDVR